MVHNPKNSQRAMQWCLETAIGLIFKAVDNLGKKITADQLNGYFHENIPSSVASKRQINQMIYDLKRRHYIDVGEGDSVILTNRAKIKIIDTIVESKRRDGRYRMVSFDIPESKRLQRDSFRMAIKRMGFRQIQKSLWACKYNLSDLVEAAISEYKVSDYVAYFVVEKSNIGQFISDVLSEEKR